MPAAKPEADCEHCSLLRLALKIPETLVGAELSLGASGGDGVEGYIKAQQNQRGVRYSAGVGFKSPTSQLPPLILQRRRQVCRLALKSGDFAYIMRCRGPRPRAKESVKVSCSKVNPTAFDTSAGFQTDDSEAGPC